MNNIWSFTKTLVVFLALASSVFSQSIEELAQEAKKRNITTKEQAIAELQANGISENEARQMARMRGIEYDDYVDHYFKKDTSTIRKPKYNRTLPNSILVSDSSLLSHNFDEANDSIIIQKDSAIYFGYDIFVNNPFADKEYLVGNIDEGYLIAPGDVLRIFVYGDNVYQQELEVDINGNIMFPDYGLYMAAGFTFKTTKERLSRFLGKYFSGLQTSPQKSFIDVSLTQIRPVKVTILGECMTPGPHLLNGFATVLNAIYASGGIKTSGSLRSVKVYRNNSCIKDVDLYNYITTGHLDNDIRLMNNDIIFISPRVSSIELKGEVKKEAIYELKDGEGLNEVLKFSGGLLPTASIGNIAVKRITPFKERISSEIYDRYVTSINYSNMLLAKKNFELNDGDVVSLSAILDKSRDEVKIAGSVNKAGTYAIHEYSDLKKLITVAAQNLKPQTYYGKVDIFREDMKGNKSFITYNLKSVLDGQTSITLEENDSVYIYSMSDVQGEQLVSISGFIDEAKILFWRENMTLYDLVFQSTSLEELEYRSQVLTSRIDLKRFDLATGLFSISSYSLDKPKGLKATTLKPKDQVVIYSKAINEIVDKKISIFGFVKDPGEFDLTNDMTIEDAILAAEGFKEYASKDLVIVNRENFDSETGKVSDRFEIQIDLDYLQGKTEKSTSSFTLEDNDIIIVRQLDGYEKKNIVTVSGEIYFPGPIVLENKITSLTDIISFCGGLKSGADLSSSYIIREGKILSLDLKNNRKTNIFESGDQLVINPNYGTVETVGAVQNENLFVYEVAKKAKYYIRLSGGKVRGESAQSYVILPNKQTKKISWLKNPKVKPNSRIVVNRKIKKDRNGDHRFLEDATKVLSLMLTSLTAIIVAQKL